MAASLLAEVRKHGLRENNYPEKIGFDLCPELFDARVFDGRDVAIPRVVHKNIKFTEGLFCKALDTLQKWSTRGI